MTFTTWTLFVGTVLLMMSTPGPSHLLMLSTSATNGFKRALATAAGDLSANAIQMGLAGFGLATVLATSRYGFSIIKWGGVAYLIWMGIRIILKSHKTQRTNFIMHHTSLKRLWFRGFMTSASNPKAVVFFTALFPQFINAESSLLPQILILSVSYIIIDGMFLAAYGKGASTLAAKMRGSKRVWIDRLAGVSLIGAAILLGLKSMPKE